MDKKGTMALLLLAAVLFVPLITTTSAIAYAGNIASARSPDENERQLTYEDDGNTIKIDSMDQDMLEIDFSTQNGISLKLEYHLAANATETELELETQFKTLIEFVDLNHNGVYDQGEEIQTKDLTNINYSSPQLANITSSDGTPGYKIESHSVGQSYTFQIVAYIFEKGALVNDTTVSSTEMKINIAISNFPYAQSDTALALLVNAKSEMEVETETAHNEQGHVEDDIEVKSTTFVGYFSWFDSASVDGTTKPVNSTVTKTGEGSLITLVYPHGTSIVHDPVLGVASLQAIGLPISSLLLVAIGAAVAALLVFAAIRRARPRIQNSA